MNKKEGYVIKDEEGNFVSEFSFSQLNRKGTNCTFSSYTGQCEGFRHYPSERYADKIKTQLEEKTKRFGLNKKYQIEKIKYDTLNEGKYITKTITKK